MMDPVKDSPTTITLGEKVGGDPIEIEDEVIQDIELSPGGLPIRAKRNGEWKPLQVLSYVVLEPPGRFRRWWWKLRDWILRRGDA